MVSVGCDVSSEDCCMNASQFPRELANRVVVLLTVAVTFKGLQIEAQVERAAIEACNKRGMSNLRLQAIWRQLTINTSLTTWSQGR